jgi:hypothetical protein
MRRFVLVLTLGLLVTPFSAGADVPPPDTCGTPGGACSSAPPDYKSPGVCTKQRCSRPSPKGNIEYDCNRCVPKAKPKPKA